MGSLPCKYVLFTHKAMDTPFKIHISNMYYMLKAMPMDIITGCQDNQVSFKVTTCPFQKSVCHIANVLFTDQEVDTWPLKSTFLTFKYVMSVNGHDQGHND